MKHRALCLCALLAAVTAGCGAGGATVHRRPGHLQVFAGSHRLVSPGGFRTRTVNGVRFFVPARLSSDAIELISTTSVNVIPDPPFAPRATPPGFDASAAAAIQRPYRVEVIANGPARRRVDVSWEETCGSHRLGATGRGESGGVGGHGQRRARLPAVVRLTLPRWSRGQDSCDVSALVLTNRFERGLSVELAND